jgi:hypothetical protein
LAARLINTVFEINVGSSEDTRASSLGIFEATNFRFWSESRGHKKRTMIICLDVTVNIPQRVEVVDPSRNLKEKILSKFHCGSIVHGDEVCQGLSLEKFKDDQTLCQINTINFRNVDVVEFAAFKVINS